MADIPINEVTRRVQFTGNTTTGPFAFTFNILSDDDIIVYKNFVLQTITTHYTVSTNANGTGSITLTSPLVASDVLTIIGGRALERTTDFVTAGDLLASSLNEQLDSQVIMSQQLDEKLDRALKVDIGDQFTDLSLPSKANRLGTVLAFNATSGDPEAGPQIADVSTLAAITADIATLADIEDGTDATDAIQTVAGISSNVSTVAGISGNVTTVAGISSNVTTVAGISANTTTVAGISSDVTTVAGISSNVSTVAGISSNVTTVAGDSADIQALAAKTTEIGLLGTADAIADMNTLATSAIVTDLDALANLTTEIDALGDITSAISTVSGISANVTTVAGISANVTSVAGNSTNINAVAGNSTNINAVAADATDIGTVATNISNVNTVAGNNTNITTVAGISSNVTTVAGISANVTTVAGDTTNIGTIATNLGGTDTIGTVAGSISNVNTVGGAIANVNTVATNISGVNSFAERYRVGSSDPTTSLDEGDLFFNTTSNAYKFYDGSAWQTVNVSGIGSVADDSTPQLGGNLDLNSNDVTGTGNLNITGNIALSGTVDGRDIATDGTKLDGIESGATADQTASEILTAIKTVDGSGSGLDADTVDGLDSSAFLRSNANDTTSGTIKSTSTSIPQIHIDSSGQAYFKSDRGSTSQGGGYIWTTAGTDNWYNNLFDSSNSLGWYSQSAASRVMVLTTSGDLTLSGELIADSYNEKYNTITSSSNAITVDCHNGNAFAHTLTENTTFTFSNPPASGTAFSFSIEIIQDASASGYTVTWPTSVDWPSATAPTLTATASAKDVFVFYTRDGGTNWYGFTAGQALG